MTFRDHFDGVVSWLVIAGAIPVFTFLTAGITAASTLVNVLSVIAFVCYGTALLIALTILKTVAPRWVAGVQIALQKRREVSHE
jgi:hypothetical protein